MAVTNPPAYMDQDTYAAQFDRRWLGYDFLEDSTGTSIRTAFGGIVTTGDLLVSQNGTPNMTVNVAAGVCYIRGTSISTQGIYRCIASSTTNLAIAAAHATLERWDLVVGRIYDNTHDGSGFHKWELEVVTGTPSGSPSEPSLPASSFKIARVTVPAADTAITDSQITNSASVLNFRPAVTELSILGSTLYGSKIQFGRSTINATDTQTETDTTVSFPTSFATAPKVVITQFDASSNSYVFRVQSTSTASFVASWRKPDNSAFTANATTQIDWIAIGT